MNYRLVRTLSKICLTSFLMIFFGVGWSDISFGRFKFGAFEKPAAKVGDLIVVFDQSKIYRYDVKNRKVLPIKKNPLGHSSISLYSENNLLIVTPNICAENFRSLCDKRVYEFEPETDSWTEGKEKFFDNAVGGSVWFKNNTDLVFAGNKPRRLLDLRHLGNINFGGLDQLCLYSRKNLSWSECLKFHSVIDMVTLESERVLVYGWKTEKVASIGFYIVSLEKDKLLVTRLSGEISVRNPSSSMRLTTIDSHTVFIGSQNSEGFYQILDARTGSIKKTPEESRNATCFSPVVGIGHSRLIIFPHDASSLGCLFENSTKSWKSLSIKLPDGHIQAAVPISSDKLVLFTSDEKEGPRFFITQF